MRRLLGILLLLGVVVTGCDLVGAGAPGEGTYPEACDAWGFPARQCRSIVFQASQVAGVDLPTVARTRFLPFERETTLGGGRIALVAFDLPDGTTVEQEVVCAGVNMGPVCNAEPVILVGTGLDRDVPCTGEPPEGCATVPPTPPAAALQAAVPLELETFPIRIDRLGGYRVEIGTAVLPNGYLSERTVELADPVPDGFWVDHLSLIIESEVPGREPAGNVYREPFEGPEPVRVFAVFAVTELFEPGVLELRNIVVR